MSVRRRAAPPAHRDLAPETSGGSRSLPRPLHGGRALFITTLVLALWAAVAHQSGSGWVQAVGAVVAGVVVIGLVGPAVATASLRCSAVAGPADADAGEELRIAVRADRSVRLTAVVPAGEAVIVPGGRGGELVVRPARRGVLRHIAVDAASAWPFGLVWWSRRLVLELPRPVYVAPAPREPLPSSEVREHTHGGDRAVASSSGELRGTRPYRPGDDRRRVHWPVSAHAGELMLAEHEEAGRRSPALVRAALPADEDLAEERAGRVLGSLMELIAQGRPVVLETTEDGGHVVSELVHDPRQARRRLASAVTDVAR